MNQSSDKYLKATEVAQMLGVSRWTIWRWRKEGLLPPAFIMGRTMVRWREEDIKKWIEDLQDTKA
mgnify:CR=1 FL=1|jgi:excisionase family DNA binding protein|tara:strand:+ start:521 stop:715 length:195 start_codon:yes stop_codon:yes gene_type:complete